MRNGSFNIQIDGGQTSPSDVERTTMDDVQRFSSISLSWIINLICGPEREELECGLTECKNILIYVCKKRFAIKYFNKRLHMLSLIFLHTSSKSSISPSVPVVSYIA